MNQETTYKVIATHRRPLFICKAIPNPFEILPPCDSPFSGCTVRPKDKNQPSFKPVDISSLQRLLKGANDRFDLSHEGVKLNPNSSRSRSCQLANHVKETLSSRAMKPTKQSSLCQGKRKSIKEYLRLAYKRAEMQRANSYKLPEINRDRKNMEASEDDNQNGSLQKIASMKSVLKKKKSKHRPNFKEDSSSNKKEEKDEFFMENISGWELHPKPDYF